MLVRCVAGTGVIRIARCIHRVLRSATALTWPRSNPSATRRIADSRLIRWRSVTVERAVVRVDFLRRTAAMIAGDVRDDDLFRRRHPEQIGVKNQMIRMLVVALVADVIAGVVQKRRVGQRITILPCAPEALAERVEQDEREPLHVRRVGLLDVAPEREVADRTRARLARVGDRRRDARRLEQQSFTNPIARHDDLARLDAAQNLGRDRDAGDDDVGALRVESRHGAPLVGRHVGEHVENMLEIRVRNVRVVNGSRRENALT